MSVLRGILPAAALLFFTPLAAEDVVIGEKLSLHSEILNENRVYRVSLPGDYDDEDQAPRAYPVIYFLDAEWNFAQYAGIVNTRFGLGGGNIPDVIMVAIDTHEDRTRDLTPTHVERNRDGEIEESYKVSGGGDAFLDFVIDELVPHIEKTYRTAPHRVLIGHSFGGLLTTHSFLTRPGVFQGYLTIDTSYWWDDKYLVREAEAAADRPLSGYFYASLAHHDTTGPFENQAMLYGGYEFINIIERDHADRVHLKHDHFNRETHGSVVTPSFISGLRFIYGDHLIYAHGKAQDPHDVMDHYKALSARYGFDYQPPEGAIAGYAQSAARIPDDQLALDYLELNTKLYPKSAHAWARLADWHREHEDSSRARKFYKKALSLDPDNKYAPEGLEKTE